MTLSISSFEKAAKCRLKEGNCTFGNDFFFLFPCIICGVKIGKLEINKNVLLRETTLSICHPPSLRECNLTSEKKKKLKLSE